ncbi:TIGR03619 family F420-dependent LLM class oxidoreductase [Pseudonocardia sp. KRD291]|uniref:TIGR03619 family F420-dependent LLM class oxidoreductase n=1 Tax=Pseudonocardia sp. KRD291 TaxID=2792007 RepID=UPI001C4A29D8|nr:TIGR03619 family F420-dependent LLM class oxidoreductase [Pseudonocardia sp. KRD291]MBW0101246.1 TIGR03619 family F420-dependent LLM class oxidoreductase [Pseudonocardia sp. KRD291]
MRIDVQHATADPAWSPALLTPAALTRFARAVEESGYGALAFTDHPAPSAAWVHADGEGTVDPFSALGFCAAVTSTVRLLTLVLVLGYRPPLATAHQAASLDALSGGRLLLGVGTGYLRSEFAALGVDFDRRRELFDEALVVLRPAFGGEDVPIPGGGGRATRPQPRPARPGGPPLWVHGNSRWGRERAARHGAGWIGVLTSDVLARTMRTAPLHRADLARVIEDLRERTVAAGRPADAVEAVVTGVWPLLDVREGWDAARLRDDAAALGAEGADRILLVVRGDDPAAAEDTVRALGEDLVRPLADV